MIRHRAISGRTLFERRAPLSLSRIRRPRRRGAVTATLCSSEGPRQRRGIDGATAFEWSVAASKGTPRVSSHQSRRRRAGVDGSAEITNRVMGGGSACASTNWPRMARLQADRPRVMRLREDRPRVARLRVTVEVFAEVVGDAAELGGCSAEARRRHGGTRRSSAKGISLEDLFGGCSTELGRARWGFSGGAGRATPQTGGRGAGGFNVGGFGQIGRGGAASSRGRRARWSPRPCAQRSRGAAAMAARVMSELMPSGWNPRPCLRKGRGAATTAARGDVGVDAVAETAEEFGAKSTAMRAEIVENPAAELLLLLRMLLLLLLLKLQLLLLMLLLLAAAAEAAAAAAAGCC
uniref:Uncharacterized protein n=1 Tax=Ananas comosus var. bracteatus TaxID=296719 RepID=A0A6V7PP32_ANACO|nr:unnamed protein product [Ananas comosus var. bracteatus]